MNTNAVPSNKTSPQFARMLRSMMLVDQVVSIRNAQYLSHKMRIQSSDAAEEEKSRLMEQLAKQSFHPEMSAITQYAAIQSQIESMKKEQLAASSMGRRMPRRFMEKLEKLEQQAALPVEAFVAQNLLQSPTVKLFRGEYPEVDKQLKIQIREAVRRNPALNDLHPCARHLPATVDVFKSRYPLVAEQLERQLQTPPPEMPFVAQLSGVALGLLKTQSPNAYLDPKLNSRAFGAICMTGTFAPMIRRINYGVTQVLEKVSLKPAIKKMFALEPMKQLQRVAMGVGLSLAMLSGVQGLLPSNEQHEIAQEISQLSQHLVNEEHQKLSLMSSVHVPGVEHAPDPETTVLFSPSLTVDGSGNEPAPYDAGVVYDVADNEFISEEPSAYGGQYLIKEGDTLSEIIETQLEYAQVAYSYEQITELTALTAEVNGIDNVNMIKAGDTLTLIQMPGNENLELQSPEPEFASAIDEPLPEPETFRFVESSAISLKVR